MSLLEALLTEGYRDPHEVWIALRSDGQKGSGTINDPYDGGTRLDPPLSASLTCNRKEFVVCLLNHGLNVGDPVAITGVPAPGDPVFNGTAFTVQQVLSSSHFTLVASGVPFAPPPANVATIKAIFPPSSTDPNNSHVVRLYWPVATVALPANHGLTSLDAVNITGGSLPADYAGTYPIFGPNGVSGPAYAYRLTFLPGADVTSPIGVTLKRLRHRFDEVMRSVPTYSLIHLGPGTFETRGFAPVHISDAFDFTKLYTGYILRAGQRLLGSGLDVTMLNLVFPVDNLGQTSAVGNASFPNADYAEVSDLTIDCYPDALSPNPPPPPYLLFPAPFTCGAVLLGGSFIKLRRIRAIHFCVQALAECFVLSLAKSYQGGMPTFDVIEDCIVEQPGENNTHETTLISIVGDAVTADAISPIVRHNYHNCEYSGGHSSELVAVDSLSGPDGSGIVTLNTKRPHNRTDKQNVLLLNATPDDSLHRGSFKITAVTTPYQLKFYSGSVPPFGGSDAFIGPDFFGRGSLSGTGCVTEGNALFNCRNGLYQDTGITRDVVIRDNYGANLSGGMNFDFNPNVGPGAEDPPRFARTGVNLASLTHGGPSGKTATAISQAPHGLGSEMVEISGALLSDGSIPPSNTYNGKYLVTPDATDNTKFTYLMLFDPMLDAKAPIAGDPPILVGIYSLTRVASEPTVAIFETAQPHQLRVGDAVIIIGARIGANPAPSGTYNDTYGVAAVISSTKFTYVMKNNPGGPAFDANPSTTLFPIRFTSKWQVRRITYENNICDLYAFDNTSVVSNPPRAISTNAYAEGPPFMFPQSVIRGNLFRLSDAGPTGTPPSGPFYLGMRLDSSESMLVEGNVVNLPGNNLIHYLHSSNVNAFNNLTPSGTVLPLSEDVGSGVFLKKNTLEDNVQDAITLSLI